MAGKLRIGFEGGSATSGVETAVTNTGGTGGSVAISTTHRRSGTYGLLLHSAPDDSNYVEYTYSGTANVVSYASVAVKFLSFQNGGDGPCAILEFINASAAICGTIAITDSGALRLYDGDITGTQRGSDSATLSLNTWYIIQLGVNNGGSPELDARYAVDDGETTPSTFASGAMTTATNAQTFYVGAIDFVTGLELAIDDVMINDDSGSDQNSFPGIGKLVMARPTGAGDNAATAGTFSSINEIPVTDTVTSSANRIELDNNPTIAEYEMTDSSTLGIASNDTIVSVSTMIRIREEVNATTNYVPRLKSASGGTTSTGTSRDAGNTSIRTNPNGTNVANHFSNALFSYTDPTTGIAWTPTGTNSIDNMQMGVSTTTANDIWVAWMGAYIEYIEYNGATTFRDSTKGEATSGTAISVTEPVGTQVGDVLLFIINANSDTTVIDNNGSTPTTATDVEDFSPNPISGHTMEIRYKTKAAGDPQTWNFTSGASGRWSIVCVRVKNPDPTTLFDVAPLEANAGTNDDNGADGEIIAPAISTAYSDSLILNAAFWDSGVNGTLTLPSGYTLLQNTLHEQIHTSWKRQASAGTTGSATNDNTEFSSRAALLFAVKDINGVASGISPSDSITVTESVTVVITPLVPSVFDSVTVTESVTLGRVSNISVFDAITITESVNVATVLTISANDSVAISETIVMTRISNVSVFDAITITESVTVHRIFCITLSDSVTVTDVMYATQIDKDYSKGPNTTTLPTNSNRLPTGFTQQEYIDVSSSDDTRVAT